MTIFDDILAKIGLPSPRAYYDAGGAPIHEASRSSNLQRARNSTPQDTKKAVRPENRRRLVGLGRNIYANLGSLRSGLIDKANLSVVDGWLPQYEGEDIAWGMKAEAWLMEWFKIMDVRGPPFDFWTDLYMASISVDRDGDFGIMLIDSDGYPMIQFVPGHRIDSRFGEKEVVEGKYKGLQICDGVITSNYGRPVAYKILGDTAEEDYFVSARDMMLVYDPEWYDQNRGIPGIAHAIPSWIDIEDIFHYLKTQVKIDSALGIIEYNETGEADDVAKFMAGSSAGNTGNSGDAQADGNSSGLQVENVQNYIRYMRANSGSKIEIPASNRPGANVHPFLNSLIRGCLQGHGIPFEIYDSREVNGGALRVIVDRFMRTIRKTQNTVLWTPAMRIVGYGLAKAAKLKLIPSLPKDWWKWGFTLPARLTPDAGYDAKIDMENLRVGADNLRDIIGKSGRWWEDVLKQKIRERKMIEELCREAGIDPSDIQLLTPNQSANGNEDSEAKGDKKKKSETP